MNFPYHQRGMGFAGWLLLILVLGSCLTIVLKLAPHYIDYNTISKIMDEMETENGLALKNKTQLISAMDKKFKINQIRTFPLKENLTLTSTKDGAEVILDYEVREAIVSNIDIVVSFDKTIELRN
ncbi:MAG: DUF4845 domain-containing protein [Pseudomonadales bacterium]|nr:DUF4845 domain-containing protein [Pseudomonadales bacterium]